MVCEAVEKCPGEAFGTKDLGPFIKRQIAGHQGGALFVALAKHFKQKFGIVTLSALTSIDFSV